MFLNERMMPEELLYYKALAIRTDLTREEKSKMYSLQKGYEGECLYDKIFDEVGHENVYIFRDVYLKIENATVQYDSLIISDHGVTVNEIKNYSGDYVYKAGRFYKHDKALSNNAFSQLNRSTGKLMTLRSDSLLDFEVTEKVVYPNDDFKLHSEDNLIWSDIVVRSNLRRYFRSFKNEYTGQRADKIASLIKSKIVENTYFVVKANASRLRKGLYCGNCKSFKLIKKRKHFLCANCKMKEDNETHLLRAMSDYRFLFYNEKMTCKDLLQLIDNMLHHRTVHRHLLKHCNVTKKGNETTYTLKYYDFEDAKRILEGKRELARIS